MSPLIAQVNITVVVASFAVYTLAIVAIGLYSARYAKRSNEDFFLAGRSLGPWVAALSASASSESGWVTLGLVGIGYGLGVQGYWVIPGCLLGYLFNWFVVAGRMNDQARRFNAVTLPDYFAHRFNERIPLIRTLAVIVILAAMMAYVAAQLAAAGKTFTVIFDAASEQTAAVEPAAADPALATNVDPATTAPAATMPAAGAEVSGVRWEYSLGVLIGAAIVLLYTVSGGFRAVCWTDFLQALLMVGALVVFPAYLLINHGGYGFIQNSLAGVANGDSPAGYLLDPWAGMAGWALLGFLLGSHALGINFGYPGMPHVLVRFMALKDRREAKIGGFIAFFWGLCVYWGAVTIGLFARSMHELWVQAKAAGELTEKIQAEGAWTTILEADSEVGLVASSIYMLTPVLSGVVVAAVLAAICSTADSQLVVAASSAAYDLYAKLFKGAGKTAHMLVNRLTVLALGIGAVLLVFETRINVYQYVLTYGWAMLGAAFGPQVILAVLWRRSSYAGCLAGMLVGFVVVLAWGEWYDKAETGIEVYNLPLAFVCALIVNIVVSLIFPRGSEAANGFASNST